MVITTNSIRWVAVFILLIIIAVISCLAFYNYGYYYGQADALNGKQNYKKDTITNTNIIIKLK